MCNHICGSLNNWTPNYRFWYNMYSYSSKTYIVCRWRESKGLSPVPKWGEAICENELVNFFDDPKHKSCSCASVYYKYIFFLIGVCLFNCRKYVVLPIEKSSVKMSDYNYDFKLPYYPESDDCKVPYKTTPDAAGYDLYAAEDKDISPGSNAIVSLDLRIAIPKGFFGKIFSRSGLCLNHKITAEADSGYRGIVNVLLFNHSDEKFSVKVGQRIAQVVFLEKIDVKFEMVQSAD